MDQQTDSKQPGWRGRVGGLSFLLICTVAVALLSAGPASAYSRGFLVRNNSDKTFTLTGVRLSLPPDKSFEGRPPDGSKLPPGGLQRFELSWYFGWYPNRVNANYTVDGGLGSFAVEFESTGAETHSRCPSPMPANLVCSRKGDQEVLITNG
jgi:hypothetical protein